MCILCNIIKYNFGVQEVALTITTDEVPQVLPTYLLICHRQFRLLTVFRVNRV